MLTKIKLIGITAAIAIIGLLGVRLAVVTGNLNVATGEIQVLEEKKQAAENKLIYLKDEQETNVREIQNLQSEKNEIESDYRIAQTELESYKGRENVVRKKPTLVERRANAASKRVFMDIECASGSTSPDCESYTSKTSPDISD